MINLQPFVDFQNKDTAGWADEHNPVFAEVFWLCPVLK